MAKSKLNPRAYRLSFGGTRAKKYAPTKREAYKDARYWIAFGQMKVCVEKRLPSGDYKQVGCVRRKKTRPFSIRSRATDAIERNMNARW
jgi:hypothetical protein